MPKEVDQFLETNTEQSVFDKPLDEGQAPKEEVIVEEKPEDNREEKRTKRALKAEREANAEIAQKLADTTERLERISEAKSAGESSEYLKSIERIYGNDTPEAQAATELLKAALQGVEKSARESALSEFREEQRKIAEQTAAEEKRLDSFVEQIEDEYNVTLTPDMQKTFFRELEKASPKDAQGNITSYADPDYVWERIAEKVQKKPDNRAKDLASRSMTASGSSQDSTLQDNATERLLREAGII